MGIITLNPLAPGAGDRQEVTPILKTWAQLKDARDAGNLIPGQYYRITDYVTTSMAANTRSAGHPFDIIVRADSKDTLNEQAWAVKHDGDTYFEGARLEAWELKYQLDNVQWSQRVGTLIEDENDGYTALSIGTVDIDGETYILWDASEFEEDYGLTRLVSLSKEVGAEMLQYDPETGEIVEDGYTTTIAEILGDYTEPGKGTITWMKDEFGNIAGYDFKNIQQKRWKVTDELGRSSLDGKYLGVLNNLPVKLDIEDEEDFIWAYLYSVYDYDGGTQDTTDHSISGRVHDMDTNFTVSNNNAFVWSSIDYNAYDCKFSGGVSNCSFSGDVWNNSFSGNIYRNTFSGSLQNNSFSGSVNQNSFSGYVQYNSFSGNVSGCSFSGSLQNNSFSGNVTYNSFSGSVNQNSFSGYVDRCSFSGNIYRNTFSGNVSGCSFSGDVQNNSFSGDVWNNSFSGSVYQNSFSGNLQNSMITGQLSNLQINASSGASGTINGLYTLGKIDSKTITVTTNAAYPTYAAMTTVGQLKTWNPAD